MYVSALPFAPEQSHAARKFCSRFPKSLVVIKGKFSQWPMVVFTAEHHKDYMWHLVFVMSCLDHNKESYK